MNYFELFEIPINLRVNKPEVSKKYFELQKKYHPDFFSNADEEEQQEMLDKSSMINKGYKILQNPDETIRYVLQLKGLIENEEKYELPPDFLMEMLELNEELMNIDEAKVNTIEESIHRIENDLYKKVKPVIESYNKQTTNEDLLQVKDYYFKKKYLKRILERLEGMRNIAPL